MTKEKVAFLGPVSSYSHQATLGCFPEADYELVPVVTIRDIFEAVQSGTASRGVVPFENSTNGSVVFTLDLFADRELSYPDISVCGEIYQDVHHCLLGHKSSSLPQDTDGSSTPTPAVPKPLKPRTKPLSSLDKIQRIYSHPQAFGQCELFLGAYLKGIERIDVTSTSKAAELVKADTTGTSAAIASEAASVAHKLDVLARNIEDTVDNTTRFFVLRKGLENDKVDDAGLFTQAGAHEKSLVSFTVDHKSPGALADALDSFKKYQLNLTSINSRPSKIRPFQYIFFVEFEGSKLHDPQGVVKGAFELLDKAAQSWRWLGSWTDQLSAKMGARS
ncbi:prephenate dehydratase [Pseudogymnoascus verrucosus]|uniref:prephenate dehydratase n=1 Tax=Pseudogymnoascus verrucosus TaxID=342668 RepID=A0A1B8GT11_9PEZI|nr:prephenate dehydratase [Pseudogymnoascus verrucosus]OBT98967.1 prephenate dehydratase [Pseudogymnoascus verrucosus]